MTVTESGWQSGRSGDGAFWKPKKEKFEVKEGSRVLNAVYRIIRNIGNNT